MPLAVADLDGTQKMCATFSKRWFERGPATVV